MLQQSVVALGVASVMAFTSSVLAAPVSLKELDLMVRMHTPDNEILNTLSKRSLLAPLDDAATQRLAAEGASPSLIAKIKGGKYALSADEAARVVHEQAASAKQSALPPLTELLPMENTPVTIMSIQFPPKMQDYSDRLTAAMAANKDWFTAYMKEHREKPLPYTEKMGLTEAEYREYLALGNQGKLGKLKDAALLAKKAGPVLELRFDKSTDPLQPMTIDLDKQTLTTPLATIASPVTRDSGENGGLLGPHQSYTWQSQTGTSESGTWTSVSFSVGKLSDGSHRFIQYKVSQVVGGKTQVRFETLLFY